MRNVVAANARRFLIDMLNVEIKTVPHKDQRYATCGDWFWQNGVLCIRVSKMSDWRYEFIVAVHELIEAFLCVKANISQKDVDKFDMDYEKKRERVCSCKVQGEPGDCSESPYRFQHCAATGVERLLAVLLLVGWSEYEIAINSLDAKFQR